MNTQIHRPKLVKQVFNVALGWAAVFCVSCGAPPPPPVEPQPPLPEKAAPEPAAQEKAAAPKEGSIEYFADASELVVIAKVQKNQAKWMGKKIVTLSDIALIDVLKGAGVPKSLSVMFQGGAVGVIRQDFSDEITLAEGETAVLFLKRLQPKGGSAEMSKELRIVNKISLLAPFERESKLKNNRRIAKLTKEIAIAVKKGAN
jgi:hypothetical protein